LLGIENLDALHPALETLHVLHLFLSGKTPEEIGSALGFPPGDVESILDETVYAVRKWLDEGQG
jgi:DNA-directed RNA polymerase specialized sigma24 family protein